MVNRDTWQPWNKRKSGWLQLNDGRGLAAMRLREVGKAGMGRPREMT